MDSKSTPPGEELVRRHEGLWARTGLVSTFTLLSRILGLIREKLAAHVFGDTSGVFDAFITAWRVPNLFRRFLGEGALSTAFQTAQTQTEAEHGREAGRRLFIETARVLTGVLLGVMVVMMGLVALVPDRMPGTDWYWLGPDPEPVRELTIRVMPFVLLVCLSALVTGALHVRGKFLAPAAAPACLNLAWIGTLVWIMASSEAAPPGLFRDLEMTRTLAYGVLLAGVLQLVVQVPALRREKLLGAGRPLVARPQGAPGPWEVIRRSAPLALGAAVYQINVMVDGLMAEGLLRDGGPTCHYYAGRLQQFPMALISIAATSAVFPALAALGQTQDLRRLRDLHDRTQRAVVFFALPASVGLAVLAVPVVEVCLGGGHFGTDGILRTSLALQALTLAILPAGAAGLVARTFYAMGDLKTPVRISCVMLVLNAVLNIVFIKEFGMDVEGLALASAVTTWGNLLLLFPGLGRRLALPKSSIPFAGPLARMAISTLFCGVCAWVAWRFRPESWRPVVALVGAISVGGAAYGLAAWALSVEEARGVWNRLRRKSS